MLIQNNTEMHHKSTYIVIFRHSFFDELLHHDLPNINPAFHCLTTPSCLADFVSSRCTDLNLSDGRFWLQLDLRASDKRIKWDKFDVWEVRTEGEMLSHGYSLDELFSHFHPDMRPIRAPFIPYLGRLGLCRNAIPNCRRSETYREVASLFQCTPDKYAMFGLTTTEDQSLSHVPLVVGMGRKVHIRETSWGRQDYVNLASGVLKADCSLRVHLYPYGLCTSFIIISLSAPQGFSTADLITFLNRLFSYKEGGPNSLSCNVGKHYSGSMIGLHDWVRTQVGRAVFKSAEDRCISSSQLHTVVCLNTEQITDKRAESIRKEVIGILARDVNWNDFDDSYASSYRSFFGKYVGEYSLSISDNLLLSFGSRWKQYHKRKSRVRFYWSLLSIFEFIVSRKFLSSLFVQQVDTALRERSRTPEAISRINRIGTWLDSMEHQHTKLNSPHRKFYHEAVKLLNLDIARYTLARSLDQYQNLPKRIRNGRSYDHILHSLQRLRSDLHAEIIQVHHQYSSLDHKLGAAITTWENQQEVIEISLNDIHQRIQDVIKLSSGDLSLYERDLVDMLGEVTWGACRDETKLFLLTAEYLYNATDPRADYSGAMIEYCKGLEVELNSRIIDRLIPYIVTNVPKGYISAGRQKIGPNDLTRLTLGAFPYLLARSWTSQLTDRRYSNPRYDQDFTDFFDSHYGLPLWHRTNERRRQYLASKIQTIADYRNGAAHMRGVTRSEVKIVRDELQSYDGIIYNLWDRMETLGGC